MVVLASHFGFICFFFSCLLLFSSFPSSPPPPPFPILFCFPLCCPCFSLVWSFFSFFPVVFFSFPSPPFYFVFLWGAAVVLFCFGFSFPFFLVVVTVFCFVGRFVFPFCLVLGLFYPASLRSDGWGWRGRSWPAGGCWKQQLQLQKESHAAGERVVGYWQDYVFRFQHTNAEQQKISRGPKVKYSLNFLSGCAPSDEKIARFMTPADYNAHHSTLPSHILCGQRAVLGSSGNNKKQSTVSYSIILHS